MRNTASIATPSPQPDLTVSPFSRAAGRVARSGLVALLLALAPTARAANDAQPPLTATLSGTLAPRHLPPIAWEARAAAGLTGSAADTRLEIEARADGLVASVSLRRDPSTGVLAWEVHSARADLAQWWRGAAAHAGLSGLPADLELSGEVRVHGKGTLAPGSLRPVGELWAELDLPTVASTAAGFRITDASARLHLDSLVPPRSAADNTVAFREADVAGVGLRDGRLRFRILSSDTLRISGAEVEALDGAVEVGTFDVHRKGGTLAPFSVDVVLAETSLAALAALLPEAVTNAEGRLAGRIRLRWSAEDGLAPQGGSLVLSPSVEAGFRLRPQPGLLTRQVPEHLPLLPAWMGPLARWIAADNPAYPILRDVERGALPLKIDRFELKFLTDDPLGRTARVNIAARPATPGPVERVTFEINLSGPLEQVVRLGLDDRVKLRAAP